MVALSKTLCLGAGVSAVAVERVMFLRILVLIEKNAEQKNFRHSVHSWTCSLTIFAIYH
jgi:hypothetical protein